MTKAPPHILGAIYPLRRTGTPGVWKSRNGEWTFIRHESDPAPKRWFVYYQEDKYPTNEGSGITTLRDAAEFAQQEVQFMWKELQRQGALYAPGP